MKKWTLSIIFIVLLQIVLNAQMIDSLIFQVDYQSPQPFEFKHRNFIIIKSDSTYNEINYFGNANDSYIDFKNWQKETSTGNWHYLKNKIIELHGIQYKLKQKRLVVKKFRIKEKGFGFKYSGRLLFTQRMKYKLIEPRKFDL